MKIERDPQIIIQLLQKKTRASAADLGTNAATMKVLEAHGTVREDGIVKTGKKGRPPVAYVIVDDADLGNLPVIEEPTKREGEGVTQAQIDTNINEIMNQTAWGRECTCLKPGLSAEDIRRLNSGCTNGRWVCGALDALRRRIPYLTPSTRGPVDVA